MKSDAYIDFFRKAIYDNTNIPRFSKLNLFDRLTHYEKLNYYIVDIKEELRENRHKLKNIDAFLLDVLEGNI